MILYFFILNLSIVLIYILGHLITSLVKVKFTTTNLDVFVKLLLGLSLIVIIYSFYITVFVTIQLTFLPIIFYILHFFQKANKNNKYSFRHYFFSLKTQNFLQSLLFVNIWFTLQLFIYYDFYNNLPELPHPDFVSITNKAVAINHSGIETTIFDRYLDLKDLGTSPYHYYEVYVIAFFTKIFNINALLSNLYIAVPIAFSIVLSGFMALIEVYFKTKTNIIHYLLCFLSLFGFSIFLPIYNTISLLQSAPVFSFNIYAYTKLYPTILFLLASVLALINNKKELIAPLLLCLVIVNIANILAISATLILYFIISKLFFKSKINFYPILLTLITIISILSFYKFTKGNLIDARGGSASIYFLLDYYTSDFNNFKIIFNVILGSSIQIIVLYLFWLVIIIIFYKKWFYKKIIIKKGVIIFTLLYLIALATWAGLHFLFDSVQLFNTLGRVIIQLSIFILFFSIFTNSNRKVKSILLITLLFSFYFNLKNGFIKKSDLFSANTSAEYLRKIYSHTKDKKNLVGGFILDKTDYSNVFLKNSSSGLGTQGKYMAYTNNPFMPISLSVFDIPINKGLHENTQKGFVKSSFFYNYVQKQKTEKKFQSVEQSQADFIEKYKLNYLIVSKNAKTSSLIKVKIKEEIIDEVTGERFLILSSL